MRLGLLGGTFDPVHVGHLILAETAREQLRLDRVVFVPAGVPWRKAVVSITDSEHRLAMLRLATAGNAAFAVSDVEVTRAGPSYTAETLKALAKEHPGAELFFLLGDDALADLPNWYQPRRILQLATLAVARRPGGGPAQPGDEAPRGLSAGLVRLEMPRIDISASAIRARVRDGLSVRYLVPDAVEEYIREHGLYRSKAGGAG